MKKLLFILSICFVLTGCKKPLDTIRINPTYEIVSIEGASILENGSGALVGYVTGGLGGLLVGSVAEDTLNKLDIKSNTLKCTLKCIDPAEFRGSGQTVTLKVKESDAIAQNWKLNCKLQYINPVTFCKYKDKFGMEYWDTPFSEKGISWISGYFQIVKEQ